MNQSKLLAIAAMLAAGGLPLIAELKSGNAADPGALALALATLPCPHCKGCPHDEIVYQDVVCHRCVMKPDKKEIRKTVYDCKEVPFCLHKLPPLFGWHKKGCCDTCGNDCRECECPRFKKVLVKKEVVCEEICTTKCVIEEYVERVPVRVCRACPHCSAAALGCSQLTPACAPPAPGCAQAAPLGPITRSLTDSPAAALVPPPPVPLAE